MPQRPTSSAIGGDTNQPALPAQKNPRNSDDGVLDSIGKAIADPVKTGAEEEELKRDGESPPAEPKR